MNDYSIFKEVKDDIDTLRRHILIIRTLLMEQPQGIIKMSQETGIPEHKIRYSLRILEREGIIEASREGAILTSTFMENKRGVIDSGKKTLDEFNELYKELKNLLENQ